MATGVRIVGGGLGGLTAAIAAREAGLEVDLFEAHAEFGGRARSSAAPYIANWGPHALYRDGSLWAWLQARDLVPGCAAPPLRRPLLYRYGGELRRVPTPSLIRALARVRRTDAPIDQSFLDWATKLVGRGSAVRLSRMASVFSFDHDPGRLSAAFVQPRLARATSIPTAARFVVGGWSRLVDGLVLRAQALGARLHADALVDELPKPPVILAIPLARAAGLLHDGTLRWPGARTALLDVAVHAGRRDPYIVWDLDRPAWAETYSHADRTVVPPGQHLIQAQTGLGPSEELADGVAHLEAVLDAAFLGFRDRQTWQRQAKVTDQSGALDPPGASWQDRPAVDRGEGVYLVTDMSAAPGLLSEVSHAAAIKAVHALSSRSSVAA